MKTPPKPQAARDTELAAAQEPSSCRASACLRVVIVAAIALAAEASSLRLGFLADDFYLLAAARGLAPRGIAAFFTTPVATFYRPLLQLSVLGDLSLWGMRPAGFHLTNVVLHIAAALLVMALTGNVIRNRPAVGMAAGVLFALYPLHAQAVTWMAGRADELCTVAALGALVLFTREQRRGQRWAWAGAVLLSAAALLAKEMAISLPLLALAAAAALPQARRSAGAWLTAAAMVAMAGIYLAVRTHVIGALVGAYGPGRHLQFAPAALFYGFERPLYALVNPFDPLNLGIAGLPAWLRPRLEIPLGLIGVAALWRWWSPAARLALSWMVVSLLPIVTLGAGVTDGRLLYLPSAFFCLLVAAVAARAVERAGPAARRPARTAAAAILLIAALAYGCALWSENWVWARSSRIAQGMLDQMGAPEVDSQGARIYVINLPVMVGAVPCFSMGLSNAVTLYHPRWRAQVVVVSRVVLPASGEARIVAACPPGRMDALVIEAMSPAYFDGAQPHTVTQVEGARVTWRDAGRGVIEWKNAPQWQRQVVIWRPPRQ